MTPARSPVDDASHLLSPWNPEVLPWCLSAVSHQFKSEIRSVVYSHTVIELHLTYSYQSKDKAKAVYEALIGGLDEELGASIRLFVIDLSYPFLYYLSHQHLILFPLTNLGNRITIVPVTAVFFHISRQTYHPHVFENQPLSQKNTLIGTWDAG